MKDRKPRRWRPTVTPWSRPLGTPVADDPRDHPWAVPFFVYDVEENDLHFTISFRRIGRKQHLFVAEEPEAVYVVLAVEPPLPRLRDPTVIGKFHEGSAWETSPHQAHGMLNSALANRPIIDATRGEAARRLTHPASFDDVQSLE